MSFFRYRSIALFVFISMSALESIAQTSTTCPWLTVGTASRALGGDATLSAHVDGNWSGSCVFTRTLDRGTESIEILVAKTDPHACPAGSTALQAIGNQAMLCQSSTPQKQPLDIIAGRVRDTYFVVKMTNIPNASQVESAVPHGADPAPASLLERIAEQVSESLF